MAFKKSRRWRDGGIVPFAAIVRINGQTAGNRVEQSIAAVAHGSGSANPVIQSAVSVRQVPYH
jgi:hypothetical protein